jgi:regulatory protein
MPELASPSLMARALRFLSRREHSRQELRKKLLPHAAERLSDLDDLLDRLEKESWLSNERYAEGLVRRKSERYGSLRIIDELKQQSISTDTINRLKETLKKTEGDRAWALWSRKYAEVIALDPKEKSKQVRYLVSKGFPLDLVIKITAGRYKPLLSAFDDEDHP